jgi:response regulator of citrate/malate metabolism
MSKRNNHVLLIDDDDMNNIICEKILLKSGFTEHIDICTTVDGALQYIDNLLVRNKPLPDYIFLDINLPNKSGWDFMKSFSQKTALFTGSVFIFSSYFHKEDIEMKEKYPFVKDMLAKPFSIKILEKIIKNKV